MKAYADPKSEMNSPKWHTGEKCVEQGCDELAGTWYSPYWCFKHNVERLDRIGSQLEEIQADMEVRKAEVLDALYGSSGDL